MAGFSFGAVCPQPVVDGMLCLFTDPAPCVTEAIWLGNKEEGLVEGTTVKAVVKDGRIVLSSFEFEFDLLVKLGVVSARGGCNPIVLVAAYVSLLFELGEEEVGVKLEGAVQAFNSAIANTSNIITTKAE